MDDVTKFSKLPQGDVGIRSTGSVYAHVFPGKMEAPLSELQLFYAANTVVATDVSIFATISLDTLHTLDVGMVANMTSLAKDKLGACVGDLPFAEILKGIQSIIPLEFMAFAQKFGAQNTLTTGDFDSMPSPDVEDGTPKELKMLQATFGTLEADGSMNAFKGLYAHAVLGPLPTELNRRVIRDIIRDGLKFNKIRQAFSQIHPHTLPVPSSKMGSLRFLLTLRKQTESGDLRVVVRSVCNHYAQLHALALKTANDVQLMDYIATLYTALHGTDLTLISQFARVDLALSHVNLHRRNVEPDSSLIEAVKLWTATSPTSSDLDAAGSGRGTTSLPTQTLNALKSDAFVGVYDALSTGGSTLASAGAIINTLLTIGLTGAAMLRRPATFKRALVLINAAHGAAQYEALLLAKGHLREYLHFIMCLVEGQDDRQPYSQEALHANHNDLVITDAETERLILDPDLQLSFILEFFHKTRRAAGRGASHDVPTVEDMLFDKSTQSWVLAEAKQLLTLTGASELYLLLQRVCVTAHATMDRTPQLAQGPARTLVTKTFSDDWTRAVSTYNAMTKSSFDQLVSPLQDAFMDTFAALKKVRDASRNLNAGVLQHAMLSAMQPRSPGQHASPRVEQSVQPTDGRTSRQQEEGTAKKLKTKPREPIPCAECGKDFVPRRNFKYCSQECLRKMVSKRTPQTHPEQFFDTPDGHVAKYPLISEFYRLTDTSKATNTFKEKYLMALAVQDDVAMNTFSDSDKPPVIPDRAVWSKFVADLKSKGTPHFFPRTDFQ